MEEHDHVDNQLDFFGFIMAALIPASSLLQQFSYENCIGDKTNKMKIKQPCRIISILFIGIIGIISSVTATARTLFPALQKAKGNRKAPIKSPLIEKAKVHFILTPAPGKKTFTNYVNPATEYG